MKKRILKVPLTRNGYAALWEEGGAGAQECRSVIIAKADGSIPKAIFVQDSNADEYCNGRHALVVVMPGYYMIVVGEKDGEAFVEVWRVHKIDACGEFADVFLKRVNYCWGGKWQESLDPKLKSAVDAAFNKACTVNCTRPFYVRLYKGK